MPKYHFVHQLPTKGYTRGKSLIKIKGYGYVQLMGGGSVFLKFHGTGSKIHQAVKFKEQATKFMKYGHNYSLWCS